MRTKLISRLRGTLSCLLIIILSSMGCRPASDKDDRFILNPSLNKMFDYSLIRISSRTVNGNTISDSIKIDFTIGKIAMADSVGVFKITFSDFKWKKPPMNIRLSGEMNAIPPEMLRAINIFDSIGFFLKGTSLEAEITKAGTVLDVRGIEALIESAAKSARIGKGFISRSIADHISADAIKDLLNSIFSAVPGKAVHETDKWYPGFTLTTKAPIKVSSILELDKIAGDTAFITIHSLLSAQQSEGGNVYMKGEQKGNAMISYSTGMPYRYETNTESITTTSRYKYPATEYLLLERK